MRSNKSSSMSRNFERRIAEPAELNRKWTRPNSLRASSIMSSTAARLVTSMVSASAWPPAFALAFCASIISAVFSTPASSMSAQTTLAPSRANTSAAARPMPDAAPVMTMVLPWK